MVGRNNRALGAEDPDVLGHPSGPPGGIEAVGTPPSAMTSGMSNGRPSVLISSAP